MHVRAMVFQRTVESMYNQSDEWGMIVAGRLAYVNHIPAAHAFTTMSAVPVFCTGGGGGGRQMPIWYTHVETGIYYQKNL